MARREVQKLPELWGPQEIKEALQVTRSVVYDWIARDDFPEPAVRFRMGPAWLAADVRAWRRRVLSERKKSAG